MLVRFRDLMGTEVEATDGSLGNAIKFFVNPDDWTLPLVMVGGGRASTGELMVPTRTMEGPDERMGQISVPVLRRALVSSRSEVSGSEDHGVFDALRLVGARATARGEDLGTVKDLLVNTERPWDVRYLVVDVDALEPGREEIFSTDCVRDLHVERRRTDLDVRTEDVGACPRCDLREGVEQEYERGLHEHYQKTFHLARFG